MKRILAFFCVASLMFVLAVPAFANQPPFPFDYYTLETIDGVKTAIFPLFKGPIKGSPNANAFQDAMHNPSHTILLLAPFSSWENTIYLFYFPEIPSVLSLTSRYWNRQTLIEMASSEAFYSFTFTRQDRSDSSFALTHDFHFSANSVLFSSEVPDYKRINFWIPSTFTYVRDSYCTASNIWPRFNPDIPYIFRDPLPKHSLTVQYQFLDGKQASPAHQETLVEGSAYRVPSPTVTGFLPDRVEVSGTMGTAAVMETVIYSPIPPPPPVSSEPAPPVSSETPPSTSSDSSPPVSSDFPSSDGGTVVPPSSSGGGTVVPPSSSGGGTVIPPPGGGGNTIIPPPSTSGGYDLDGLSPPVDVPDSYLLFSPDAVRDSAASVYANGTTILTIALGGFFIVLGLGLLFSLLRRVLGENT